MTQPAALARALAKILPYVSLLQCSSWRFWVMEGGEPFADIELEDSERINLRLSVHCSPEAAAAVALVCGQLVRDVQIMPHECFYQKSDGTVLYGDTALGFWKRAQELAPLHSSYFKAPPPHPI